MTRSLLFTRETVKQLSSTTKSARTTKDIVSKFAELLVLKVVLTAPAAICTLRGRTSPMMKLPNG